MRFDHGLLGSRIAWNGPNSVECSIYNVMMSLCVFSEHWRDVLCCLYVACITDIDREILVSMCFFPEYWQNVLLSLCRMLHSQLMMCTKSEL